jgi:hypothetical protein
VFVEGVLYLAPCDNYMASWFFNHRGARSKAYCRLCHSQIDHAWEIRDLRDWDNIVSLVTDPLTPEPVLKQKLIVKRHAVDIPGFCPLMDCGIDQLHTLYLGVIKHVWTDIVGIMDGDQRETITAFYRNVIKNFRSFQAKEFRKLIQRMPFALFMARVDSTHVKVAVLMARMSYLCALYELTPLELSEVDALCEKMVRVIHVLYPTAKNRSKLHLLIHLAMTIKQLG